jgi:hypothetical protein
MSDKNNEITIDIPKEFGTIHVHINGNAYARDMIVRDIKEVLKFYLSNNHLFINGRKESLK